MSLQSKQQTRLGEITRKKKEQRVPKIWIECANTWWGKQVHAIILMSFNLRCVWVFSPLSHYAHALLAVIKFSHTNREQNFPQTATLTIWNISLCNYIFQACANIHMTLSNHIEFLLILSAKSHIAYGESSSWSFFIDFAKNWNRFKSCCTQNSIMEAC